MPPEVGRQDSSGVWLPSIALRSAASRRNMEVIPRSPAVVSLQEHGSSLPESLSHFQLAQRIIVGMDHHDRYIIRKAGRLHRHLGLEPYGIRALCTNSINTLDAAVKGRIKITSSP